MLHTSLEAGLNVTLADCSGLDDPKIQSAPFNFVHLNIPESRRFILRYPEFLLKACFSLFRTAPDIVIAADLYTIPIAFRFGVPVIYDAREIYSGLSPKGSKSLNQRFLSAIENRFIRRCSSVIVTGKHDADIIQARYNLKNDPVVIKNLPRLTQHSTKHHLREKLKIGNQPLLMYQGIAQKGRGLEKAIDVVRLLPDWHLVIAGGGVLLEHLKNYAGDLLDHRVHFTGWLPYQSLLDFSVEADAGWVFIEPISESYRFALPNKLFEFIAARVPVVASDLPAMAPVIRETGAGILLSPDATVDEISTVLQAFYQDRKVYSEKCRQAATGFLWDSQKERFIALISS